MIIRCQFTKVGDIAYVSHLDLLNIIHRAINRSKIDIKYSEGFNPHPKLAFSPALSLGVSSIAEYVDIEIDGEIEVKDFMVKLNKELPKGIEIKKAKMFDGKKSLSAIITHNIYKVVFKKTDNDIECLEKRLEEIKESESIIVEKKNKKGQIKEYNQREKIYDLHFESGNDNLVAIVVLQNSPEGALKASDFMDILDPNSEYKVLELIKMSSISIVDDKILEVM